MKDMLKALIFFGLFLVPALTVYVANDAFFPYITGKNFAFRIIVEVILGAWVVLALLDAQYRPRFSWVLATFGGLLGVMLLATLGAEHVPTAFWSNFERMDGYITLLHVFAFFLVLGSVLKTTKQWSYLLHASVVVASYVALMGVAQLGGATVRVDSTLGNAAYMAVYMLFHIFFLALLFVRTNVVPYRVVYVLIGCLFTYVLLQTGTRGTALGLVVGAVSAVSYIALFAHSYPKARTYAFGGLAALALIIGGFYAVRDTDYIQSKPALARIANIDLGEDLRVRTIIWGMSVAGIKEQPLLGWGNGNFNYVFNEQYDPRLYAQEQWFDRVHNIAFDWLIAGGVLGFVTYLSIFAALLYYLVVVPWRGESRWSVFERGIIFGLIAGYVTHNVVVFDNIVSYIFFAMTLAMVHQVSARDIKCIMSYRLPAPIVAQIVAPVVAVAVVLVVYTLNVPNMRAATGLIDAFKATQPAARLEAFQAVLALDTFAHQEIVEQLAQQTMAMMQPGTTIDPATRDAYLQVTEEELKKMVVAKPNDARLHVFFASYYRAIGNLDASREQLAIARTLSPRKQAIIIQQGAVEIAAGQYAAALPFFAEAYELDTTNEEAKEYYVASLLYVKDVDGARSLLQEGSDTFKARAAASDFILSGLSETKEYTLLAELYELRVAADTSNAQNWASLAFVYHQLGDKAKAVDTLTRGATAVPSFASTSRCVVANINANRAPEVGCQ